ncbi:MAG TPA: hypothetical protein VGK10_17955 [Prolixibacteraceae bacterium]
MELFEENLQLISGADLTNVEDYSYAMQLTCDYGISLENSGSFLKGLLYLEDAIDLMEKFPPYQNEQLFAVQAYELAVFHKARAFYNLTNYKDSLLTFKSLHEAFPEKEQYRSWIFLLKVKKFENWIWIGMGVMLVTLIIKTFLNGKFPWVDQVAYWILLLALISTLAFEIGKRLQLKKLNGMKIV